MYSLFVLAARDGAPVVCRESSVPAAVDEGPDVVDPMLRVPCGATWGMGRWVGRQRGHLNPPLAPCEFPVHV